MWPRPAIIPTTLLLFSALAQAQGVPGAFFPMAGDLWAYDADHHGCGWVSPNDTPVSSTTPTGSFHLTCTWASGSFDGNVTFAVPAVTPPATLGASPDIYRFDAGKTLPITVSVSGAWSHPPLSAGIVRLISAQSYAGEANFGECGVPDLSGAHQDISADTVSLSITCNLQALRTESDPKLVPHLMGWTTFAGNLWFFTGTSTQVKSFPLTEANIFWRINVYYDFGSAPNVKIDHVELVQRTQNVSGSVPLVDTLPTLVRVFVAPGNSQAQPAVSGTLTVKYADGLQDTVQADATAVPVASPDRNKLSDSLNFSLKELLSGRSPTYHPGTAQFNVKLTTAAGKDLNVSKTFAAEFLPLSDKPFKIAYMPICYRPPGAPSVCPGGRDSPISIACSRGSSGFGTGDSTRPRDRR